MIRLSPSVWRAIDLILRLILGGLFVYAGWSKLGNPTDFADSIATFQMLPDWLIVPFALALPPFEIIAGALVITGFFRRTGCLALIVLTVVFSIALFAALARGISVDCGCFGGGTGITAAPWFEAIRDIVLLAIAVWLYRYAPAPKIELY